MVVQWGNIKLKTVPLVLLVLRALVALLVKNKQHNVQRPQITYVEIVMQVNIKPRLDLLEPVVLHVNQVHTKIKVDKHLAKHVCQDNTVLLVNRVVHLRVLKVHMLVVQQLVLLALPVNTTMQLDKLLKLAVKVAVLVNIKTKTTIPAVKVVQLGNIMI